MTTTDSNHVLSVRQAQEIFNEFAKKSDERFLREVAVENLAEELSDIINGVVAQSGQNKTALEVLNGEAEGSIKKAIDAAFDDFATKVSDDNVVNTYKELIDYAAANGAEFTTLVGQVTDLAAKMTLGVDGNEEEYATVKEYVEAYVNEQVANIEFATEDEVKSIIDGIFADSGSVDGE